MSSPTSVVSYGWEEVSALGWDEESSVSDSLSISDSSSDSEHNDKVNDTHLSSAAVKQEEPFEENSGIVEIAEKTMDKPQSSRSSKAHELSESEDSSSEPHIASALSKKSANSNVSLNETANSNVIHSSNRNVANKVISNESSESHCNSKEADRNTSKASMDIREKLDLLRQNNEFLNNEDYIPVKVGEELSVENFGDEEIWMIQCPVDLNPKKLLGKEIDFSGVSEFAVETKKTGKVYTATAFTGRWKTLSCLLPSTERKQLEAVVVNAAGQIIITENIMSSPLSSTVPTSSNEVEFPENLKVRHPLLGADYERELHIRRQRLLVSSSKKKKKKKKERTQMSQDNSYGTISEDQADDCTSSFSKDLESQMDIAVMSQKSKKRRHSESFNMNSDPSEDNTGKLEAKHLKKKLKKSPSSNSVNESMEIDSHVKKSKKRRFSESFNMNSDPSEDNTGKLCTNSVDESMEIDGNVKKSKKRRHSESFNMNSDPSEDNTGKLEAKHFNKKLKKSQSSNSVDESLEVDSHVNQEYSQKKKKKKKNSDVQ